MIKSVKLFLDYLFYRSVQFYRKNNDSDSVFMGSLIVTLLQVLGLFFCYMVIHFFSRYGSGSSPELNKVKWAFVIISVVLSIINSSIYNENRWNLIKVKWSNEDLGLRKKRGYLLVGMFFLIFVINICYGAFMNSDSV